ncbi:MAG: leucine-rich repeat protein [Paludibacteraceae bacterium]|nr:leucine-rich repeat protein [Paludibacteraceae bacterium]
MKHKFLSLFVALVATTALWASNTITYTATEDLSDQYYLAVGSTTFGPAITSHTFSNGIGTITCSGEITKIGSNAFYLCRGLTSVTIPNSVTTIGDFAFCDCSGLTSITIPNSVTTIGDDAFFQVLNIVYDGSATWSEYNEYWGAKCMNGYVDGHWVYSDVTKTTLCGCLLTTTGTVIIPSSVTTIGEWAFYNCSGLTSVTIPSSVTTIGEGAFYNCSGLTSVTIPNSVTTIGDDAFSDCSGLTSPVYNANCFAYMPTSYQGAYTILSGIQQIAGDAFSDCSGLTSITIPSSVTTIGEWAFYNCSGLTSVTIPNSVTTIGEGVFSDCSGLTSINVDAANTHYTSMDGVLFNYAKDTLIQYPASNTRSTYTIPNSVTTIGMFAFSNCSGLTSVTIPNSVTTIGNYAFYECYGLTSVTIPNSVKTIGEGVFSGCIGLTSVTIPNSVTTIGNSAFWDCSGLTSVTIGNSVKTIGDYAFLGCDGLTSITIPNSVTTIGKGVFSGCTTGLISITCYATNPPTCCYSFNGVDMSIPVYVPAQSVDAYKQAEEWKEFTNILPIGAEEVPVTDPIITPDNHSVTITWPQTDNANTYTLEIRKNGELVCTLTFNSQGIMTNITFAAPARGGERTSSNAEMTTNGYRFTVTGLEAGTDYTYSITAKSASQQILETYSGEFKTDSYTGLDQLTDSPTHRFTKIIRNNQLQIFRNGKMYNAMGGVMR